jgi:DNA-binding transcriptional MerR regulator
LSNSKNFNRNNPLEALMRWQQREFTYAEAAALAGLEPGRLRVWAHRHNAPAFSERRRGRRYFSPADIAVLRIARDLSQAGVNIPAAIATARERLVGPPDPDAVLVVKTGEARAVVPLGEIVIQTLRPVKPPITHRKTHVSKFIRNTASFANNAIDAATTAASNVWATVTNPQPEPGFASNPFHRVSAHGLGDPADPLPPAARAKFEAMEEKRDDLQAALQAANDAQQEALADRQAAKHRGLTLTDANAASRAGNGRVYPADDVAVVAARQAEERADREYSKQAARCEALGQRWKDTARLVDSAKNYLSTAANIEPFTGKIRKAASVEAALAWSKGFQASTRLRLRLRFIPLS